MTFPRQALTALACLLLAACGGKVAGSDDTTGTSNGSAGSSGTPFGGGTGMAGQSTPTNPAGGGTTPASPETVANCQGICDRIAQAGCAVKNCLDQCTGPVVTHPGCGPALDAVLRCFANAPISCSPDGTGATFYGCDNERDQVGQCVSPPIPSVPGTPAPTPPTPTQPIPPQCAGGAPIPPSGMVCSGGGSASGTGGTGGGAPPTCQSECDDGAGNVWSSYCVGANCSCIYNGKTYCSCISSSPCSSCCPGI